MSKFKGTGFDDRLSTAASAKKAELEKFRAKSGANAPAFAKRQASRHAINVARDARISERKDARLASVAREAAEQATRDAEVAEQAAREAADQAARDAEVAEQAARDVVLQAERKAACDARYTARKARPRNDSAPTAWPNLVWPIL